MGHGKLFASNIAAGTHTLTFSGTAHYARYGDTSAFLDNVRMTVTPVPEPETYAMPLAGLGLLGFMARRKHQTVSIAWLRAGI